MTPARWGEIKSVLAQVLDSDPGGRASTLEKLCGADSDLRREVESLLALEAKADAVLETAAAPGAIFRAQAEPLPPPATIGPYRILHEIGRGGMGVVYLGERADGQYKKQVAIKLITSARRDLGLDGRFRQERQILAQFEHAGIARLVDGGATPEGVPYFVMEYVEGLPLLEYCNKHALTVAQRIQLFLAVCDAVAHAHHRLVVHRDLKPGNILVTEEGNPKLLDFGLARVLDAGANEEVTQSFPMMTPAYASPEQVRGEPYTVSGDVYSLGVILYELLSARRPYNVPSGSLSEIVRTVCDQEPPRLSEAAPDDRLRRRLRGDLDTIAARALEKDPRRRYVSVNDLAEDLRRHLDGRPVKARPATFFYRAGKMLRRHRIAIPAGALAAILILAFAAAAWWQAQSARRRFNEVRGLAHSVIFELHDAIAPLPGSTAARNLLIERALEYLERLSKEASGDPALQWEVALAYERIGLVQGYAAESNLGNGPASFDSLRKSAAILERLSARPGASLQLRRDNLRVLNQLASAYGHSGDLKTEQEIARKCVVLSEQILKAQPGNPPAVYDVASSTATLADSFTDQGNYAEAVTLRERVLEFTRQYAELAKAGPEGRRSLALAYKKLAALYGVLQRYDESHASYEQARAIDEERCRANPSDRRAAMDLSFDYSDLGWVLSRLKDEPAALASHQKALEIREAAVKSDPNDVRAATAVASSTGRIAAVYDRMGDFDRAMMWSRKAIGLWAGMSELRNGDRSTIAELGDAHWQLADVYQEIADKRHRPELRSSAVAEYEQARALYAGLRDRGVLSRAQLHKVDDLTQQLAEARKKIPAN
ncbi:MAG: serine/threonine-protein kinase [Acidobacteriia bacterium]|nr:serine/threonine-protein kinase [Terriglobia bacterium]